MKKLDSIIPVSDEGLYPIRTVSEVSGVNSITLRAWERRYGLFKPKRTPKGHRLYSDKDIQRIQQVLELLAKGVSIGRVAKALKDGESNTNFSEITSTKADSVEPKELNESEWANHQETLLSKINTYDVLPLEIFHHELLTLYGTTTVGEKLIRPVLNKLCNRAKQLPSLSGDYHFYKIFLSQRIGGLFLKSSIRSIGKKILLMSVNGEQSEIELLLFSMSLLKHGFQVITLGCEVSFDAIPMALSASNAEAVLLYSATDVGNKIITNEFQTLVSSLSIPIFISGSYSELQEKALIESGLHILPSDCEKRIAMIDKSIN